MHTNRKRTVRYQDSTSINNPQLQCKPAGGMYRLQVQVSLVPIANRSTSQPLELYTL